MAARKKSDRPAPERAQRFYISLSAEGLAMLREMADKRGGLALAKAAVLEEAIRRMHDQDTLLKRNKRQREEGA